MKRITIGKKSFRSLSKAGFYLITKKKYSIRDASKAVGVDYMTLYQMFKTKQIRDKQIPNRVLMWNMRGKSIEWIANKVDIPISTIKEYINGDS